MPQTKAASVTLIAFLKGSRQISLDLSLFSHINHSDPSTHFGLCCLRANNVVITILLVLHQFQLPFKSRIKMVLDMIVGPTW
jgi:hypothetical protein